MEEDFKNGLSQIVNNHPEFFENSAPIFTCYHLDETPSGKYQLVLYDRCNIPEGIKEEIYELFLAIFAGS